MRRLVVVVALLTGLIASAIPALAEITPADIDDAREGLREVASRLEDQVAAYDAAVIEEAQLRDRLDNLVVMLASRERAQVLARRAARERAAHMYMAAGTNFGVTALVSDEDIGRLPARYAYLESVAQTDLEVVNRLEAARRDFEQQRRLVDQAIVDQEGLRTEIDSLLEEIYSELEAVNEAYQELRAAYDVQEEERRLREFLATSTTTTTTTRPSVTTTRAPVTTTTRSPATTTTAGVPTTTTVPSTTTTVAGETTTTVAGETTTSTTAPTTTTTTAPPPPPAMVCPVDGAVTFRDSWGEPRSGGRTHKGVDMMAARWTPVVAIEDGYIYQVSWHSSGGLGIYLKGVSGGMWYYAHNQEVAGGIAAGTRVVAGQTITYVGSSGNASTPHLHFGWQPKANWVYANPYPIVDDLCR
ncbi:MAG: peptidoglycan DD-metalloendopeptidase family protein [Acidimicrobiia bacterium]